jgi:hypothetical protein
MVLSITENIVRKVGTAAAQLCQETSPQAISPVDTASRYADFAIDRVRMGIGQPMIEL